MNREAAPARKAMLHDGMAECEQGSVADPRDEELLARHHQVGHAPIGEVEARRHADRCVAMREEP
jgi:hypothetical protein